VTCQQRGDRSWQFRRRRLFRDTSVPPAIGDRRPVLRQIVVQEDDDCHGGELISDTPEPAGRLTHHQLYVEQDEPRTRPPDETQGVPQRSGLAGDCGPMTLIEHTAESLTEVGAAVRYHGGNQFFTRDRRLHIHIQSQVLRWQSRIALSVGQAKTLS
jgi:hypothetical protein